MKIKRITSQYRNDFSAIMVCEHCNHEQELTTGYDDDIYHLYVIPKMLCQSCKRDRSGAGIVEISA